MDKAIDLTGQTFGYLTVINRAPRPEHIKGRDAYWNCQCKCGTNKVIIGKSLRNGKTTSCGCIKQEQALSKAIGQKYGQLTIIDAEEKRSDDGHIVYKCKCDCGNIHYATINNLKSGSVSSCGCLYSKGEQEICSILNQNNIKYKQQISFPNLRSNKNSLLRFDFGIYENEKLIYLIEFQGEQHYDYSGSWFDNPKESDALKEQYCKENNIPLIKIPYWKRGTIKLTDLKLGEVNDENK